MLFFVYDPNFDPDMAGQEPTPEMMAEMGAFIGEATEAGILVTTGALLPTGTRLQKSGEKFSVTDGPFIELKELTAGFAILNLDSLEKAVEWSKRFLNIVGGGESEIVQMFTMEDMAEM